MVIKGESVMKKLFYLLATLSLVSQQSLFCDNYPVYKNGDDFLKSVTVFQSESLDFFKESEAQDLFFNDNNKFFFTDYDLIKLLTTKENRKDSRKKICEIEKKEGLEKNTILCAITKSLSSHYVGNAVSDEIERYCVDKGIEFLGGNSSYVLRFDDHVVYIPRKIFCVLENSFEPYRYQDLTRIAYYNFYKHF